MLAFIIILEQVLSALQSSHQHLLFQEIIQFVQTKQVLDTQLQILVEILMRGLYPEELLLDHQQEIQLL